MRITTFLLRSRKVFALRRHWALVLHADAEELELSAEHCSRACLNASARAMAVAHLPPLMSRLAISADTPKVYRPAGFARVFPTSDGVAGVEVVALCDRVLAPRRPLRQRLLDVVRLHLAPMVRLPTLTAGAELLLGGPARPPLPPLCANRSGDAQRGGRGRAARLALASLLRPSPRTMVGEACGGRRCSALAALLLGQSAVGLALADSTHLRCLGPRHGLLRSWPPPV